MAAPTCDHAAASLSGSSARRASSAPRDVAAVPCVSDRGRACVRAVAGCSRPGCARTLPRRTTWIRGSARTCCGSFTATPSAAAKRSRHPAGPGRPRLARRYAVLPSSAVAPVPRRHPSRAASHGASRPGRPPGCGGARAVPGHAGRNRHGPRDGTPGGGALGRGRAVMRANRPPSAGAGGRNRRLVRLRVLPRARLMGIARGSPPPWPHTPSRRTHPPEKPSTRLRPARGVKRDGLQIRASRTSSAESGHWPAISPVSRGGAS